MGSLTEFEKNGYRALYKYMKTRTIPEKLLRYSNVIADRRKLIEDFEVRLIYWSGWLTMWIWLIGLYDTVLWISYILHPDRFSDWLNVLCGQLITEYWQHDWLIDCCFQTVTDWLIYWLISVRHLLSGQPVNGHFGCNGWVRGHHGRWWRWGPGDWLHQCHHRFCWFCFFILFVLLLFYCCIFVVLSTRREKSRFLRTNVYKNSNLVTILGKFMLF